jgi:Tfp pilus assembly pilus retraction ATPase PilT
MADRRQYPQPARRVGPDHGVDLIAPLVEARYGCNSETNDVDFSYRIASGEFPVNLFRDTNGAGAVLRTSRRRSRPRDAGMPDVVARLCEQPGGSSW